MNSTLVDEFQSQLNELRNLNIEINEKEINIDSLIEKSEKKKLALIKKLEENGTNFLNKHKNKSQ